MTRQQRLELIIARHQQLEIEALADGAAPRPLSGLGFSSTKKKSVLVLVLVLVRV